MTVVIHHDERFFADCRCVQRTSDCATHVQLAGSHVWSEVVLHSDDVSGHFLIALSYLPFQPSRLLM
jgi:hypothetical protein